MLPVIAAYIIWFFAGSFVKLSDNLADRQKQIGFWAVLLGVVYGALLGLLVAESIEFATIGVGVVAAVILAGKVDNIMHLLGLAALAAVVAVLGFPGVEVVLLAVFTVLAIADEVLGDFAERKVKGFWGRVLGARLVLDAGALVVSLATGVWAYFIAILLFDIGYHIAEKA